MKINRFFLSVILAGTGATACGQIVIPSTVVMSAANNPDIAVQTGSNIVNNSTFDFSTTKFHVGLAGTTQNIQGNIVVSRLRIDGGGTKTVNGNLTITGEISFLNGIVQPTGTAKFLFTGSMDAITGAGDASFVDGPFFLNGSGLLTFPIGAQGLGYTPASILTAPGQEIGMEVVNENPGLTPAPSEVELSSIDNTHYWSVINESGASINSAVNLSLNGTSGFPSDVSAVVVEAESTGGDAYNLGSQSVTETSITSLNPFSRTILAVGASTKIDIRIHDLISPFTDDEMNDELYIENIGKFPVNTVTLLDRWGVPVKEWSNFTNFGDPLNPNTDLFDFTTLSPGNYICVVEYSSQTQGTRKKSQMVTVLKIK